MGPLVIRSVGAFALFTHVMACTHVVTPGPLPRGVVVDGHRLSPSGADLGFLDGISPPCNQTDSTVQCCLKQNPGQYERCGAVPPEPKPEPRRPLPPPVDPDPPEKPAPDDEGWRDQCINLYVRCKQDSWSSVRGWSCYECFRNCQGQKEWPFDLCGPDIR
jgi:hypothetical protein